MTEIKHPPIYWEKMDNIVVLDPDGWRYDEKSWYEPITRNEWIRRKNMSTIKRKEKTEMTNTNTPSTAEYYQRAIAILEEFDGDIKAKAKLLVEVAKYSPKTLVKVYDEGTHSLIARDKQHYDAVNRLFDGKNKIACIKEYRALSGEGLREAKDWVEKNFSFEQF